MDLDLVDKKWEIFLVLIRVFDEPMGSKPDIRNQENARQAKSSYEFGIWF